MFVCCKLRLIVNTRARTVFLRAANWPCWANVAAYQDWSDDSNSQRSCFKNSSENSEKMLLVFEHFWLCEKSTFFALRLKMRVRCDNQYKTGADGGTIFGQPMLFECMGI